MKKKLKLYVWEEVLCDYKPGIMFAIASSIENARKQILEKEEFVIPEDLEKIPDEYDFTLPHAWVLWGGG